MEYHTWHTLPICPLRPHHTQRTPHRLNAARRIRTAGDTRASRSVRTYLPVDELLHVLREDGCACLWRLTTIFFFFFFFHHHLFLNNNILIITTATGQGVSAAFEAAALMALKRAQMAESAAQASMRSTRVDLDAVRSARSRAEAFDTADPSDARHCACAN